MIVFLTQYYYGDKIEEREMHVVCMGERRNSYKVLVGNPEEKIPLGKEALMEG